MEQRKEHPSQFHSFRGFQPWRNEIFDVKKKRKLQIEQPSFPTSKLPHWDPSFPSEGKFKFARNSKEEEDGGNDNLIKEKAYVIDVNEIPKEENSLNYVIEKSTYGHEEDLLEFGSHGNSSTELQCCSDGADILLLPREPEQKACFVLSSGRWKVNAEAESKTIKPTIDQEFEQYFSVLMPSFDP